MANSPKPCATLSLLGEAIFAPMLHKAAQRLDEGLDATKQKVLQHDGEIILGPEQIDFTERREAAKEVLKLGDCYPDRLDVNVGGDGLTVILRGFDEGRV